MTHRQHRQGLPWRRLALLAWLLLGLLAVLVPGSVLAQAAEPDLPQYEQWLREASSAAQRGDRLLLEQVAGPLTTTRAVRLPDGTLAAVDNAWLQAELAQPAPDLAQIGQRLGAIIDALAAPQQTAQPDAIERLREILSRPPFGTETREPSWWEQVLEQLSRWLEQLFGPAVSAASPGINALGWVLLGLGSLAILALLAYAAYSLRRGVVREAASSDDDPEAELSSGAALQQATEIARGGDYRTAVRYLYLSLLLRLDERGLLRYDRALTNREYLQQVRANPDLHRRLVPVVETFDRVWYGHVPLDAATFDAYRRQIDDVKG